ncbi:hypothetical protein [Flagellimonas okinawensis]|uniref:Peptidase MA-like domain-containing protein n=1 Tax=Flagellimonas okinawensis TaxID=3031324 RepID=A0ABT5XRE9_9FLAO|nr:hypothetical protein [[Muricauda] okinawensis]MDF0708471.1 hypothetical protein [[Muricauda] okinawensis]
MIVLTACHRQNKVDENQGDDWTQVGQVERLINNINFTFPDSGFAFENKEALVQETFDALQANQELIGFKEFNDTIYVRFLRSRDEMFPISATTASGNAWPHIKTLYVVANKNSRPPIKHELMHLMSLLEWGYPPASSTWMNEGLGSLAENNCSGWTVEEIYRHFMHTNELISMDLLVTDFYKQPEMFAYHQSGYMVAYLLSHYSIEQFEQLWKNGFDAFENIYQEPFESILFKLEEDLKKRIPDPPNIESDTFFRPCE